MPSQQLRRWVRFRPRTRLVAIGLAVVVASLTWILWADQWKFRRELPRGAEDVHEWIREDGFLPDYSYMLKAKLTEKQFREYVERLELTPHSPMRHYTQDAQPWLRWDKGHDAETDWWDPSESLEDTFVSQRGDIWTYAKYERGYLYLKSLNH